MSFYIRSIEGCHNKFKYKSIIVHKRVVQTSTTIHMALVEVKWICFPCVEAIFLSYPQGVEGYFRQSYTPCG